MKLLRTWAVARKEFLHILRDPRSLAMAIVLPMLQMVLFGYALTLDVDRVPLGIWDQDQSPASRELLSRFLGSRYFSMVLMAESYHEMEKAIDTGKVLAGLVVPVGFSARVESGKDVYVQFLVDGSDSNTATLALGYAEALVSGYSRELVIHEIRKAGIKPPREPLILHSRAWFNEELQSRNYIIPGLIAVIMNVIAALLTSLSVAREWENGTMEQLISTPIKGPELLLGKLLPYFCVGMLDVFLAVIMGRYVFAVPLRGSPALLFLMAGIFLLGVLSIGMFLSVLTKSQLLSSQAAMVITYLPALLLSGYIFAIQNMPPALQVISRVVPARYFVKLIRAIYLKGLGLEVLAFEAGLLVLFASGVAMLTNLVFKKKM